MNLLNGKIIQNSKMNQLSTQFNTLSSSTPKLNSYESITNEKSQGNMPTSNKAIGAQPFRRKTNGKVKQNEAKTQNHSPQQKSKAESQEQKQTQHFPQQREPAMQKMNVFDYMAKTDQSNLPSSTHQTEHRFVRKKRQGQTLKESQNLLSPKSLKQTESSQSAKSKSKSKTKYKSNWQTQTLLQPGSSENKIILSIGNLKNYQSNNFNSMEGNLHHESIATSNNTEERMMTTQPINKLISIFSPSQPKNFRRKAKRTKKQTSLKKQQMTEDKENMQALSNGKAPNEHKKRLSIGSSHQKFKINEEIIQSLREEVNKQVRRSQERKSSKKNREGAEGRGGSSKKHIGGIINFDTKIKLRQNSKKSNCIQDEIEKSKKDYQETKKKRLLLKKKREDEKQEQMQWIEMVKQSMSSSPRKRQLQNIKTQPDIQVEQVEGTGNALDLEQDQEKKRIILSQRASVNESSSQDSLSHYILRVNNRESHLNEDVVSPLRNPKHSKNYMFEIKQYKQVESPKRHYSTADLRDGAKQKIEQFVKEKKVKEKMQNKNQQLEEENKLYKLHDQLQSLQKDYQKGLNEFKQKQRVQSEKRITEKRKPSKKKRNTSKKKSSTLKNQDRQNIINILASPERSVKLQNYSRACFQSPLQSLPLPSYEGRAQTEGAVSSDNQSPFNQVSSAQTNYDAFSQKLNSRGSLASTQTWNQQQWPPLQIQVSDGQDKNLFQQQLQLQQFNKKSSVPLLLPSSAKFDHMIPKGKKCMIFANESMKDLDLDQIHAVAAKNGHKKSVADLKRDQLFEEFSKMRKELQKNIKEQKVKKEQEKKKQDQKPSKKVKKLKKSINLPFKGPSQGEATNKQQSPIKKVQQEEIKENLNGQDAKQRIVQKLQEVADKMQIFFKQKQHIQNQQQTFVSGNAHIIQEEESKEIELTNQSPQIQKQLGDEKTNPQIIGGEVSQIKSNEEESMEGGIQGKNENTTFLLKRMYSDEEKPAQQSDRNERASFSSEQENAVLVIQKNFRGFICRSILKEKLRIDRQFKLIRQKYEVKSNLSSSNMSQGLLSSLAFSKSNFKQLKQANQRDQKQKLKVKSLSKNPIEEQKELQIENLNPSSSNTSQSKGKEIGSSPAFVGSQSENIFKRTPQNQFYNRSVNDENGVKQTVSVFQSPTILRSGDSELPSASQSQHVFEYQPKQLFNENQFVQSNQEERLIASLLHSNQLAQSQLKKETDQDYEQLSSRSDDPFEETSPIFKEQNKNQAIIEQSPIPNIIEQDQNQNKEGINYQKFMDSPLMMNDLDPKENQNSESESKVKLNSPESNQVLKREEIKKEPKLKISPIMTHSPASQIQKQKNNLDMSSLLNYDEDKQGQTDKRLSDLPKQVFNENSQLEFEAQVESQYSSHQKPRKSLFADQKFSLINASPISSSQHNSSSVNFDKNSFQQFAQNKIKKAFRAESQIEHWINDLNNALHERIKIKQKQLKEQDLSMQTFNRKKLELERWVEKEKREIKQTQKCFIQGRLKLSQLLDNFVEDQGRMKNAISQIKKDTNGLSLKKSHSFDAELHKQNIELQNMSQEFNTISGNRRLSSGIQSLVNNGESGSLNEDFSMHSMKVMKQASGQNTEDLGGSSQIAKGSIVAFEYGKDPIDDKMLKAEVKMENNKLMVLEQDFGGKDEEEKRMDTYGDEDYELVQATDEKIQIDLDQIVLLNNRNEKLQEKSKRLSLGDDFLPPSMNDEMLQSILSKPLSDQSEIKVNSGGDELTYQLTDTPLAGKEFIFPEETNEFEKLEMKEEERMKSLVEDIVNSIINRELREKMFPRRVIAKPPSSPKSENQSEPQNKQASPQKPSADNQNQILVLDSNDDSTQPLSGSPQSPEGQEQEQIEKAGIETNILHVNNYMQEVFERIKNDKQVLASVLENVSQPLYKDPLLILSHLQNSMPTENSNPATSNSNDDQVKPSDEALDQMLLENPIPFQQSVLSVDLYLEIEKERRGGVSISQMKDSYQEENTQSFVAEMENIHNKAIFDAINEALDGFRPYGLRGPPLPWSKQSKTLTFKFGKEETVEYLLQKVKYKVLEWAHINAGLLGPKQLNYRDKEQLELMREERLARILIQEAEENEALWTDYEYEETQTKLDLADIVLNELCAETAMILNKLLRERNEGNRVGTDLEINGE